MNKVFTVLWISGALLLSSTVTAQGKTRDGLTPAQDGVCDELRGGPPGLYGLCVSFCEAQDCDQDWNPEDPIIGCKAIYDNYNRKKKAIDPELPCLDKTAAAECPCFSPDECGEVMVSPYQLCLVDFGSGNTTMLGDELGGVSVMAFGESYSCFFSSLAGTRNAAINGDEFSACRDSIIGMIEAGDCTLKVP
jgi:hypothetical protein